MKERERFVVSGLVVLMLLLWLGFLVHRDPRFAGSFWGGVLGVSGAALMLVPLAYSLVKRVKWVQERVWRWVSMRTLLAWHIYAGTSARSWPFCTPGTSSKAHSGSRSRR
jgi:hypothetical protein